MPRLPDPCQCSLTGHCPRCDPHPNERGLCALGCGRKAARQPPNALRHWRPATYAERAEWLAEEPEPGYWDGDEWIEEAERYAEDAANLRTAETLYVCAGCRGTSKRTLTAEALAAAERKFRRENETDYRLWPNFEPAYPPGTMP